MTANVISLFQFDGSANHNFVEIANDGVHIANLSVINQLTIGNVTINTTAVIINNVSVAGYAPLDAPIFTSNVSVHGDMYVSGNVYLEGNTTVLNSSVIATTDKKIFLANGLVSSASANGSGIVVGNFGQILYDDVSASFQANIGFTPGVNNQSLGSSSLLWNLFANQISGQLVTANQPLITSNNSLYLGGLLASAYQTVAGLSSSVAALMANSSAYIGTLDAANVVSNSQLQANLANYQTVAGLAANVLLLAANNTSYFGGHAVGFFANVTAPYFSVSINVGSNVSINTSSLNLSGTVLANGSIGSPGQLLTSAGGDSVYWDSPSLNVRFITSGDTLAGSDGIVIVNAASNVTFNLSPASSVAGKAFKIKNVTNNTVNVVANSTDLIDGSSYLTIGFKYTTLDIVSTGSNWSII